LAGFENRQSTRKPAARRPVRAYRNLRGRGWAHALRVVRRRVSIAISRAMDARFDARFGSDTAGVIETSDLEDVTSPHRVDGIRYEPTRAIPFRRVLRAAGIPATGSFIDLGCGKGRSLMLAAMAGFGRVVGVDYSPGLCAIARRNLDTLRTRLAASGARDFEYSIHAGDVASHAFAGDETVVYFFNPFGEAVLRSVLAASRQSLRDHPREVWLVYHNPVWRHVLDQASELVHVADYSFGGCDFAVYRSRTA
jgi:SAM-dependent methyltransferase